MPGMDSRLATGVVPDQSDAAMDHDHGNILSDPEIQRIEEK